MNGHDKLFLGIDVGTQGVRALVVDAAGRLVARESVGFEAAPVDLPPGWAEQEPADWWSAVVQCLRKIAREAEASQIAALAVDSTSGTFLPIDPKGRPLRRAMMYNDGRAVEEAATVQQAAAQLSEKLGYGFPPAFALCKLVWLARHEPNVFERAWKFLHPADWIAGKLTGSFHVSDTSDALKTGYDLVDLSWPSFIETDLGIPLEKLPHVVSPGDIIGKVTREAAEETGLALGTAVAAGLTDGTASVIASGARRPGEWNSILGTTLVLRGVSAEPIRDPQGRMYAHRHPDGFWLPGGASNTGGECLEVRFGGVDLAAADHAAANLVPTSLVVYPLARRGERFPFVNSDAEGFVLGEAESQDELYAAYLEGVGLVERCSYELAADLGAPVMGPVFGTGGGTKSPIWLQIRADILQREIRTPVLAEAAMGAALVAASRTQFGSVAGAVEAMVRVAQHVEPNQAHADTYREKCATLWAEWKRRGYVQGPNEK